jgi:hypothetical protein
MTPVGSSAAAIDADVAIGSGATSTAVGSSATAERGVGSTPVGPSAKRGVGSTSVGPSASTAARPSAVTAAAGADRRRPHHSQPTSTPSTNATTMNTSDWPMNQATEDLQADATRETASQLRTTPPTVNRAERSDRAAAGGPPVRRRAAVTAVDAATES